MKTKNLLLLAASLLAPSAAIHAGNSAPACVVPGASQSIASLLSAGLIKVNAGGASWPKIHPCNAGMTPKSKSY